MAIIGDGGQAGDSPDRHVLVVITGGTITMKDSPDGLVPTRDFWRVMQSSNDFNDGTLLENTRVTNEFGESSLATTLRAPPRTNNHLSYKYSLFEFSNLIDSSYMDGSHWNLIVKCLGMNWDNFDAFVVLHGTDTLAYTASALAFMLGPLDKTVILTGSQLSIHVPHNDAHDNLLDSLTVAATYTVPEVAVVFHHHLYRATRVTKVSAFSMAAFTTPNARPLATFPKHTHTPWTLLKHSDSIKPSGTSSLLKGTLSNDRLRCAMNLDTDRVAVLKLYPGIGANLINSIVQIPNLGGLVLETFGAGNIPLGSGSKNLLELLAQAVDSGIIVVSVTQCLTGSVTSAYESARKMERRGIVTGLDMTTEAAYTKLAYLLSLPDLSREEVAAKMRQDLCGELTADFREEQRIRDSASPSRRSLSP